MSNLQELFAQVALVLTCADYQPTQDCLLMSNAVQATTSYICKVDRENKLAYLLCG